MKKLFTIFFLIQLILGYSQCIEGDCQNGKGTYRFEGGAKYSGYWKNGSQIYGKITVPGNPNDKFDKGWNYEGEWQNNQPHGKGVLIDRIHVHFNPDGDRYEGGFKNGLRNGHGIKYYGSIFQDAKKYDGNFKDGYENGICSITFKNGDFFEGEIFNGLFWDEDTSVVGGHIYPSFDGSGVYTFAYGDKYSGKFKRVNSGEANGESAEIDGKIYKKDYILIDQSIISKIFWKNGRRSVIHSLFISDSIGEFYNLAESYKESKDYNKALENINNFLNSLPNNKNALSLRASIFFDLGQKEKVFKDCDRLIEIEKAEPLYQNEDFYYNKRAHYHYLYGDYSKAVNDYTKFFELNKNDVLTYNNLAWYTHLSGQSEEALKICNKGIEVDPKVALIYITRGEIKLGIGDKSEIENGLGLNDKVGACEDWEKAKSLGDVQTVASDFLIKYCK